MKFRVRVYGEKWNGRRCSVGKQLRQKTFCAEDWDEAELIAGKIWTEVERTHGASQMQLQRIS